MADPKRKKDTELPMELPRDIAPLSQQGRDFRLRLPPDLSEEIEKESVESGLPQNRIIINRLARFAHDSKAARMDDLINHMETLLAKYGTRITDLDLAESLLSTVDEALDAKPNELQAKMDKVRVIRRAMRALERKR
jgi:hypothetical protein